MTTNQQHDSQLTQLQGRPFVTDGGIETDLIFHHSVEMPHFAAFPLLETLSRVNRSAIEMLFQLRDRYAETVPKVIVGGVIGPRGDGYHPDSLMDAREAAGDLR